MGTWHTRGLRGSTLEDMVNRTNERYLEQELALIQKIPTPITPVRMDKEHRQITLAYFEQRSTVDYIGAVQVAKCWDRAMTGGRKSIRLEELDPRFFFDIRSGCFVPYLDMINLDLELRDERS